MSASKSQNPAPLELRQQATEPGTITDAIRDRALLDGLFARVPEAIVLLDTEDRILQVNPEFTRVFGYTQEEAHGRLINDLIVPEELLAQGEEFTRRGLRGESLNVETVRKHKDGTRVHVSMVSGPVSIAGSLISEYVIYREITERKRAEQRLRENEAFLAEGQRLSLTGSFSWCVATDEITWSEQLYRIFEFDQSSPVTLERIGSRVHPDDLPLLQDMIQRARHAASDFEYEHRLLMPDQSVKHIHLFAHSTRDKNGRLEYVGAAQDVTRSRVAEEQLRERELNLRLITQTFPGMLWSATAEGAVDYCNGPWLDFAAMTAEQAKGWGWVVAIYPDDRKHVVECWQSCLASGTPFDIEARMRRFDGAYRWFLFRANPLRDASGKIVKWYGTNIDIEDRKRREELLRASELSCRQIIDNLPGFVHMTGATGEVEFLNQQVLEYFGKQKEELKDWSRNDIVHPDDLPRVIEAWRKSVETGQPYEVEQRCRRADGVYRWFQARGRAVRNAEGETTAWYWLLTDIEDRKRAEHGLQRTQFYLSEGQRLAHMGCWVFSAAGFDYWSPELFRVHGLDPSGTPPTVEEYLDLVHPEDREFMQQGIQKMLTDHRAFDFTKRIVRPDGKIRHVRCVGVPVGDGDRSTSQGFVGTAIDITEQEQLTQKLRQSEQHLRTIADAIPNPIVVLTPHGRTLYVNQVALDLTGFTMEQLDEKGFWARVVHSDDVNRLRAERQHKFLCGDPFQLEFRALFKSGQYRWQLMQYNPLKDESGQIIRWYSTATDIDDRKRAEEKLRQSEENLRTITDTIRQPIVVLSPDGTLLYANRVVLDNSGLTMDEVKTTGFSARVCHPDDLDRVTHERSTGLSKGIPFDSEMRMLFKSGQYRWQLLQYNPLKDESGQIMRWYATATDIDDRKRAEERLHNENLVLREEIDRSSMFEEIVGSSRPMSQLLRKVEKVAPSDSTVLVLGETGTGKELIARALHRRSKRANRAFVKVNCAAIPQSLIASELFGHEKGAFTGALQRRVGRFEAANGGTLFLDEIGELPMETQIALLRVLQEREFERVGSNHPISVDVRLIAATNRDLAAAVTAGTFRQDLFYRLNVFPIAVPPLRERAEDIPLLVEYFVGRFGKDAGKNIRHIGKPTLEQLQGYHWPGNIRELQNVVERAVVLCESDTFVVDESWLKGESAELSPRGDRSALLESEVEMIEAALAETHGRISGPAGAAAKLGIPRQTLESKIRRLGIDKYGQKRTASK